MTQEIYIQNMINNLEQIYEIDDCDAKDCVIRIIKDDLVYTFEITQEYNMKTNEAKKLTCQCAECTD